MCKEEDPGQKTSIGALRVGDARHAAGAPFDAGLLRSVFQPQSLGDFTDAYSNPYKPLPFYLKENTTVYEERPKKKYVTSKNHQNPGLVDQSARISL